MADGVFANGIPPRLQGLLIPISSLLSVSALILEFALATLALFVYFYPVLSGLRIPAGSFSQWMWFSTWI
jgi:dolichyl-phosphate-mannose--protein O-mannosyl transferase